MKAKNEELILAGIIQKARLLKNFSQEEMADKLKIS